MTGGATTDVTTHNGVSNSNHKTSTRMTGGRTSDITIQNGVSNRNDMPGGETTDRATQTGTEITSVSVTDVSNTETTGGVSDNSNCICLLVGNIILSVSSYMSK